MPALIPHIEVGDQVRIGAGTSRATVLGLSESEDEAGDPYLVARLQGARNREFTEEVSRLTVVRKAGVK